MVDELKDAILFTGLDEQLREGLPVAGATGEIDGGDPCSGGSGGGVGGRGLGACG